VPLIVVVTLPVRLDGALVAQDLIQKRSARGPGARAAAAMRISAATAVRGARTFSSWRAVSR
jgi:hypothetical protein